MILQQACYRILLCIMLFWVNKVILFDLLERFEYLDDIPAPLRSFQVNISAEGVLPNKTTVPYLSIFEYFKILTDSQYAILTAGKQNVCPSNASNSKVDTNRLGMVKRLRFKARDITKFRVFETDGKTARVLMHASFDDYFTLKTEVDPEGNATEWQDIVDAINEGSLFNASFRTLISPDDTTTTCPTEEFFPVPIDWCDHKTIMYGRHLIKGDLSAQGNRCFIKFEDQLQHYYNIWLSKEKVETTHGRCIEATQMNLDFATEFSGTVLDALYPALFPCHRTLGGNSKSKNCWDDRVNKISYKENGRGYIESLVMGRNNDTGMMEINMTMHYEKWTADFSKYNIRTFRTCGFHIPETYLDMYLFIKEIVIPPERTIPGWIIPFGIVIATVFFILLLGCIYLAMFQTRKGFNVNLWKFFRKREDAKRMQILKEAYGAKEKKMDFDNPAYEDTK